MEESQAGKSPTNIQFLETDDGKHVTQAYDIANILAEKYKENSNNKINSSSYPINYDTHVPTGYRSNDSNPLLNSPLMIKYYTLSLHQLKISPSNQIIP